MKISKIFLLMSLGIFLFSACTTEEVSIDYRNQLSGSYTYHKTVYHNSGIETKTGTLSIVNNDTENVRLIVTPEETFYGSTLDAIDSSLIFYIPEQDNLSQDLGTFTIKGISNVKIGDTKCDAGYFPSQNQLRAYYTVSFETQPHLNYNVSILAEKIQ